MARILGEAGRYVSHQATNLRHKMRNKMALGIGLLGYIAGLATACSFQRFKLPVYGTLPVVALCVLAMFLVAKWFCRRLDELERERECWRKGAAGEVAVGQRLDEFPDEFRVVHDVATPLGNLDHVVVGPTGVFILDTKDWRGTVAADGKGELTLNGKPLDKPYVRRFVGRVVQVKEKVRVLAAGLDPYFEAVFVFTSARVDAGFGTTGTVHCIRDEQLFDYIVNKRFGKKLSAAEVERIARAFLGLAQIETAFIEKAGPVWTGKKIMPEPRQFARAHAEILSGGR